MRKISLNHVSMDAGILMNLPVIQATQGIIFFSSQNGQIIKTLALNRLQTQTEACQSRLEADIHNMTLLTYCISTRIL